MKILSFNTELKAYIGEYILSNGKYILSLSEFLIDNSEEEQNTLKTQKEKLIGLSNNKRWIERVGQHSEEIYLSLEAYENGFKLKLESFSNGQEGHGTGSRTSFLSEGNKNNSYIFGNLIDWKSVLKQIMQAEGLNYVNLSNITGNTPDSIKSVINNKVPAWTRLFIWGFLKDFQEQNSRKVFKFEKLIIGLS